MKANEFVKKFGWDKAKEVVIGYKDAYHPSFHYWSTVHNDYYLVERDYTMDIDDLKRLVESWELVELWGCLEDAKLYSFDHCKDKPESAGHKLMMAIKDVESCQ